MFILSLLGCFSVCKTPISELNMTNDMYATCSIPEDTTSEFECLANITTDSIENRVQIYKDCKLDSYITETEFLFAQDDMVKATHGILYLEKKKVEEAQTLFSKFSSNTIYPTNLQYVRQASGKSPVVPPNTTLTSQLKSVDSIESNGDFELWGAPEKLSSPWIVVDDTMTLKTVRHHLARKDTPKVHLVFQDQTLHYVTLNKPTEEDSTDIFLKDKVLSDVTPDASRLKLHASSTTPLVELVSVLSTITQDIEVDISAHPCLSMKGMDCYEGDSQVHTYYLDEATQEPECIEPHICTASKGTWLHANTTCRSNGKRLPTIQEAQNANRSDVFWTADWSKTDKNGNTTCADLYPCRKGKPKKFLSDGTNASPNKSISGKVVCALDYPSTFSTQNTPPFTFSLKADSLPELTPEPELAKLAKDTIRHDDLTDKGICGEDVREQWIEKLKNAGGGRSTTECRDPFSYVTPNEPMRYIWAQYFNNIGGGYAGVGSDQNYDFIAVAKSRWAWLYDYDPNVYRLHQILKPMILHAESPEQFLALFEEENIKSTTELIKKFYQDKPSIEQKKLARFFTGYRKKLRSHYKRSKKTIKEMPDFGWLNNPEHYKYIRTMHQQDRVIPVAGDMLAENGLRSIGDAARKMNIPIRIFYTSNAPTAWGGQITKAYSQNVTNFPFDRQSLVLTTFNSGGFDQEGYWHHNISNGLLMQARVGSGYYTNRNLIWDRVPTPHGDMTTTGLLTNIVEK